VLKKIVIYSSIIVILLIIFPIIKSNPVPTNKRSLFSLDHYDQQIDHWIKPASSNYDVPLLSEKSRQQHYQNWFAHDFGAHSPWSANYLRELLKPEFAQEFYAEEIAILHLFNNQKKRPEEIGYGVNFRPYTSQWLTQLKQQMNLNALKNLKYDPRQRAIATENAYGRHLPTLEVYFYHDQIAGQGYPFDNLQVSTIWAGTPLYILTTTRDQSWALVLTPTFLAWIEMNKIARVSDAFVHQWQKAAQKKLFALQRTEVPLIDQKNQLFRFMGYIGMVFPGQAKNSGAVSLWIPVRNTQGQAEIHHAKLNANAVVNMPWLVTRHHVVNLMRELLGRPYGWGGLYFYSDCASELKNLYTPFGIWLPLHSSEQVNPEVAPIHEIDLSASSMDDRLQFLIQQGHPFMTIIYIGGHVMLYLGDYANPQKPSVSVPLTYQDMWALKPKNVIPSADHRAVVGQSVLFPLLRYFPEDFSLASQADKKHFQLAYLDQVMQQSETIKIRPKVFFSPILAPN